MTLKKGQRLGAYEIVDRLGAGGMGEVYRAHDPRLERDVALKVLPPELAKSPERRLRFDREAKMLGALNHPNIAAIHGFEEADGLDFLVLELIEGEGLNDRLKRAPLPLPEVVDLALQIASACAAAHARGVVHRDLKPSNVMVSEEGRVKVLDFGLARSLASSDGLASTAETAAEITAMGDTLGTPAYMSPEQALGRRVEEQSDLFSFGVVLYELLVGRHPFRDLSDASLIDAILHSEPPAPSSIRQGLPSAFDTLVASLLAKAPERRPSGFGEVVTSLESLEGPQESSAESKDTGRPTIAVLPFANLSSDSENEYLADGMADEIILALSKIESLRVLSRTSSFAFKGRAEDVRSIAKTLGVRLVLEGSLRRAGDRIRVATQLVDASEGYQLWSDRYDRDSRDVFAVQEEIAEQVLGALRIVLTQRENEALQRLPTHDLEAYKLYQRGRTMLFQFTDEKFKTAQVLFRRAVERDEEFLPAWLGLTSASAWIYQWGLRPGSSEDLQIAVDASEHALAIAPDRAEALAARGLASWLEGSVDEAVDLLGRAQTVDPRLWDAAYYLARVHHSRGEHEASFRQFMRAAEIRPDDYQSLCLALSMIEAMGEAERLVEVAERAATVVKRHLNLHPEDTRAYYLGAQALELLGERSLAQEWTERALALSPDDAGVGYNVACFCVKIGELDRALELLEALAQRGWGFREWLETDPDLDPLRDDPRFEKMLDEMPTVEGRKRR